jgi:RimJ/RimL family protein N-acetyltransferase
MDEIQTERLLLRQWREEDREPFAAMNADPEVMRFMMKLMTREESDAFVDRIEQYFVVRGYGLWAVERKDNGQFIGYVGLWDAPAEVHFAPALEIGYRLAREQWGQGFATEAAKAVRDAALGPLGLENVLSFTAAINLPSRAVMERIGLRRDVDGDFDHPRVPEGNSLRSHVLYRFPEE